MHQDLEQWIENFFAERAFFPNSDFERIKKHYQVELKEYWTKVKLTLTLRDVPAVSLIMNISKNKKTLRTSRFNLPKTRELTKAEQQISDEVLKRHQSLCMSAYLNGEVVKYDLSDGVYGLAKQKLSFSTTFGGEEEDQTWQVSHRKLDHYCVYYLQNSWGDLFCLWVDEKAKKISGANWINAPMDKGFWLSPDVLTFIDQALREHGDFGVYGNVTSGLEYLLQNFNVTILDNKIDNAWSVQVDPRDGHGHFLHFDIHKTDGRIGSPLAGHYEEPPF